MPQNDEWEPVSLYPDKRVFYNAKARNVVERAPTAGESASPVEAKSRRVHGNLCVLVHGANNLLASDRNGKSDPYCVLGVDCNGHVKPKEKTKVIKSELCPRWEERKDIRVDYGRYLQILVMDRDRLTRDDRLGHAFVDLTQITSGSQRLQVDLTPSGSVDVTLELADESDLFGMSLQQACQREGATPPRIVSECIAAVEARGVDSVGLYRLCGNLDHVKKLRHDFDRNSVSSDSPVDLSAPEIGVDDIASLLKLYFRELPEPLLTEALFPTFMEAYRQAKEQSLAPAQQSTLYTAVLDQLPSENRATLEPLMTHLTRVLAAADINKMTARNLGVCFGPTLLSPSFAITTMPSMLELEAQNGVVEFLISHWPLKEDSSATASATTATPPSGTDDTQWLYKALFARFDANGDNAIDATELRRLFADLGVSPPPEVQTLSDSDGFSFEQFSAFLQKCDLYESVFWLKQARPRRRLRSPCKRIWQKHDTDGRGSLSYDQFRVMLCDDFSCSYDSDEDFDVVVRLLDANGDGSIDYAEFSDWYTHSDAAIDTRSLTRAQLDRLRTLLYSFRCYDSDASNALDRTEFAELYASLVNAGYDMGDPTTAFDSMDKLNVGTVSYADYVQFLLEYNGQL